MQSLPPASSKRKRCLLGCSKARDARGQKKRSSNRQNKKKRITKVPKALPTREWGKEERERQCNSIFFFLWSPFAGFLFSSRDAFDVAACASKGPVGTVSTRYYACLPDPHLIVALKEKKRVFLRSSARATA